MSHHACSICSVIQFRGENMAWNENTILNIARSFVGYDADESLLTLDDVRAIFAQFAEETLAFDLEETINITAGQRVYPLTRVFRVERVFLNSTELPRSDIPETQTWQSEQHGTAPFRHSRNANLAAKRQQPRAELHAHLRHAAPCGAGCAAEH